MPVREKASGVHRHRGAAPGVFTVADSRAPRLPGMATGRNGSSALKRAPNGLSTSSTNWRADAYFRESAEWPVISHVMSSAKVPVTEPEPSIQAAKAAVTISRLAGARASFSFTGSIMLTAGPGSMSHMTLSAERYPRDALSGLLSLLSLREVTGERYTDNRPWVIPRLAVAGRCSALPLR